MGEKVNLEQAFEGIIDLTKLFESIENDPRMIDEAMLKMKTEHKGPLIAAATAYFEGKNVSEQFIAQKVNEYLGSVENQARQKIQPVTKKNQYSLFPRNKYTYIGVICAIIAIIFFGVLFFTQSPIKPIATNSSIFTQGEISAETVGADRATITLRTSPQSTNAILYENSKVIGRWNRGGIITQTVVHSQGEYIYYGEVFIGNQKTVTKQVAIQYGQGGGK